MKSFQEILNETMKAQDRPTMTVTIENDKLKKTYTCHNAVFLVGTDVGPAFQVEGGIIGTFGVTDLMSLAGKMDEISDQLLERVVEQTTNAESDDLRGELLGLIDKLAVAIERSKK